MNWMVRFLGSGLLMILTISGGIGAAEKTPDLVKQVERTVKQADLSLDAVEQSLKSDHFDEAQGHLRQYKSLLDTATEDSKKYLELHKKTPHQFKNAEIRLRKQLRRLQDIRKLLPIPLRNDLDAAVNAANALRRRFIGELFDVVPEAKPKKETK